METTQKLNSICLLTLTIIALAFVLAITKVILIPFTLAIFITLVYSPVIHYFEKKIRLPRIIILLLSFCLLSIFFFLIILFVTNSIDSFIQGADQYKEKLTDLTIKLTHFSQNLGYSIERENLTKIINSFPIGRMIKSISGSMVGVLSNTFLVIFFTLFLLTSDTKENSTTLEQIKKNAGKYIQTKLLTSSLTALISYIMMSIFNLEMAFMFGVLTFLLNFIPNIGSIFAVLLPIPIMLLQYGIGIQLITLLSLLILIQVLIGNIVEPKLMGELMGLHPVTILLFLTFWGYIWGVTGMFLSVPITATLKIIFEKFEITKPIANLFSGKLS